MDIFQDDNAWIHWAQMIKEWLREHVTSFPQIDQLPPSPNLNPIENIWDVLEKKYISSIINTSFM